MQVKPSLTKDIKVSRMCKAIQILSKLYILPLAVDYKTSKIDFSFFSNRTLTNAIVLMIPHLIYYSISLFQTSYVVAALENFYNTYNIIDFTGMMIFVELPVPSRPVRSLTHPLPVPYLSLTCPLPVPYLSHTCPIPVPYPTHTRPLPVWPP